MDLTKLQTIQNDDKSIAISTSLSVCEASRSRIVYQIDKTLLNNNYELVISSRSGVDWGSHNTPYLERFQLDLLGQD
jgi:hypothetical protein